jgi:hypothetical protein
LNIFETFEAKILSALLINISQKQCWLRIFILLTIRVKQWLEVFFLFCGRIFCAKTLL